MDYLDIAEFELKRDAAKAKFDKFCDELFGINCIWNNCDNYGFYHDLGTNVYSGALENCSDLAVGTECESYWQCALDTARNYMENQADFGIKIILKDN